jgi:hypothetical protein
MYVTLNNMTSQAETNFVTEFNRILGSRKLPVTINSGDFRNTTMTPNNFGDTVIVIFDKRPQTSTLQSLASGYSGEWSNMESSTKLKFIRTEEELDELANSVVQTGSTKPVGNDIFTALAPETTGGTIPISRIQRAMELGVNV